MNIVVIGYGWVGQANALALAALGQRVSFYDPKPPEPHYQKYREFYAKIESLSEPLQYDDESTCYIVCVGDRVSDDGVQDISLIKKALDSLKHAKGTIVLRSTILPQSLAALTFDYYVPEFLHEKKAVEECLVPHFFVVGKRSDAPAEPAFFAIMRKNAYKVFEGTPEEASYVKYLSNSWNALRIAFVNEFGSAITLPHHEKAVRQSERILDFVFDGKGYMRYGRAFGGHCLPKDTRAFVRAHKDQGIPMALLDGACEANKFHEELSKKHSSLTEWFSEWRKPEISGRVALAHLSKAIRNRIKRTFSHASV